MFTGSIKQPPAKTPQPARLDEVYTALRRGLQSYLQVHQLELDSLGHQIRENKRNGRLGSLYELDKQVKAIERFMRRLEFHLSKVEELYDAYCIQRRLRDGASKMVAAFNSAAGSREARESQSEANKGFRECTEHMCSLESEFESHMGEFHVKMKGLAGFARLCAGDQYEVLMRYGRQRWRLRGRVELSNKQIWDSEEYIFLPLVTELLSIKVTELKSLANHVVVGTVSCEMLDLFCPLPQTLAVDINDLGTVKLNLEVTWSPFDKDDQTSSSSTVSKRLLSNQSPPDTPSMREQVFYSLLKRQGEMENGTVWSNSSESSDDSSSPALAHQRVTASNMLQATISTQLSGVPHKSTASTPSLSSNQEEDETEGGDVFPPADSVSNGHQSSCCSHQLPESSDSDSAPNASEDLSETVAEPGCSCPEESSEAAASSEKSGEGKNLCRERSAGEPAEGETQEREQVGAAEDEQNQPKLPQQQQQQNHSGIDPPTTPFPASASFTQEVETALESFDFLNCSDLDEEEEEGERRVEEAEKEVHFGKEGEDQNETEEEKTRPEEEDDEEIVEIPYSGCDSDEEATNHLEILMEAPAGFRNSDEDHGSDSQESNVEEEQDLSAMVIPEEVDSRPVECAEEHEEPPHDA